MAYSAVADVKSILQIASDNETHDTKLSGCITSADAVIDSLLEPHDLAVSEIP
jgi:hypothetical protein